MSAMAVSSSLNPNAPLFIPAAFRQVEDFSPEWWELVKTTAWFRDHWFRQHQELEESLDGVDGDIDDDVAGLLPDSFDLLDMESDDLFYQPQCFETQQQPAMKATLDVMVKHLSLNSPSGGGTVTRGLREKPRHEKPMQHISPKGSTPRIIHQPR